jgi:threonine dehydrogenase-like Zn-dependent dehydrogenase
LRAVRLDQHLLYDPSYREPTAREGESVVRVLLGGICATDLELIRGYMHFRGVLGHEMVGVVETGPKELVGQRVVCEINCVCRKCEMCLTGLSPHCRDRTVLGILQRDGCFADRVAVPAHNLHVVPDSISTEEAVFVEPLAAAFQVLAQCPVDERAQVAIIGAGKLGLLVAQVIAASKCRLIVIGRNPRKLEMCDKLGVQGVPLDEVVTRRVHDVVVDCSGSPEGLELAMRLVRPRGTIVLKSTHAEPGLLNLAPLVINEVNLIGSRCGPFGEAINALARQAVNVRGMISRVMAIEQAVDAFDKAADPDQLKVLLSINAR